MPTPSVYASLSRFVGRHRRYFMGASLGGFALLFVAMGALALLDPQVPNWAFPVFCFAGWFVVLHWPFLVAWHWFHPVVTARVRGRSHLPPLLVSARFWLASCFLTFFFVAVAIGFPLAYFLPRSAALRPAERAVQQGAAADEPQPVPIGP